MWYRTSHTEGVLIGRTRDDAAGEAFDKGAQMLGLGYPGGPAISKTALEGNEHAYPFPLPLKGTETCDYSFSGIKTALRYTIRDIEDDIESIEVKTNLAASYQYALCKHLIDKLKHVLTIYPIAKAVHIVGGVSANQRLRSMAEEELSVPCHTPVSLGYCTDNAAMIAAAAYHLQDKNTESTVWFTLPSCPLASAIAVGEQ